MIRGEAGIGKTRLATELRSRASAAGAQTAACAALDLGGTAPLSLWAELIRELLPSLPAPPADAAWPDDLAALAAELPAHFARSTAAHATVAPDLQRTRLFEAVVALLGWAARHAPLLLVLEDVHSADGPSLELAGYAARRIVGLPVMMLITRRELPHSAAADTLEHALRARGMLRCEVDLGPLPAGSGRRAGPPGRAPDRARRQARGRACRGQSAARGRDRASDRTRAGRGRAQPARIGAGDAHTAVWRGAQARRDSGCRGPPAATAGARPAPASRSRRGRRRSAAERHAADRRRRHRVSSRAAARRGLRGDRRATPPLDCTRAGRTPCWPASRQAGSRGRPRPPATSGSQVPTRKRSRSSSAPPLTHGRWQRSSRRSAISRRRSRSSLTAPICGSSSASSRRGGSAATRQRWRSSGPSSLLEEAEPLERARAWLRRARAYHGPICVPRAVLDSARTAIELLDLSDQPARAERSEALAAWAWAEAVAGSVEEAERLLAQLSADETARRPAAHLRRRSRSRARADAPRPVHRVLRAVDRRRGRDRRRRPTGPRLRLLGERRQRRDRGRRARTSARVPRSWHGGDCRARTAEPRDPSAGGEIVRSEQRGPARTRRAPRPRPNRRSPSSSRSPSCWQWQATTAA